MVTLRRIGVQSAGRVGFWLGVATSIANLTIGLIYLFIVFGVPPTVVLAELWKDIAISIPISGAVTGLAMALFASLYNMKGAFGGLELEFDMSATASEEKRKNGDSETSD